MDDATSEIRSLLKKSLILRLFELGVPQGNIAKKLKTDIKVINEFLKGIKKPNSKRTESEQ